MPLGKKGLGDVDVDGGQTGEAPTPAAGRAGRRTSVQGLLELDGQVCRSLANDLFEVQLADGRHVLAHLAPPARLVALRVRAGDRVRVVLARYDHTRGRIVGRT